MLQRVAIDGIELPRLYIAENEKDAKLAMSKGIPFIRWSQGMDLLIKVLLRPVLERMFPHVRWVKVLGPKRRFRTKVNIYDIEEHDVHDDVDLEHDGMGYDKLMPNMLIDEGLAMPLEEDEDGILTEESDACMSERLFDGGGGEMVLRRKLDLADYVGDMSSCVNLEVLQRLRLMPAFIGNILDCIRINVGSGMSWREGYNKRLGTAVGRFDMARQLPNLIILDVSGSIPRGISATMISLIDTLRTQLSADLIITSTHSRFYPMGCELPDPQRIRDMFGYGNEASEFFAILSNNIRGRHYGHVFSFGDCDTPTYYDNDAPNMMNTIVEHVHHYHTGSFWRGQDKRTGYAKWCHMLCKAPLDEYDTSWCEVIAK